ncbi:unnamed protein product [marine sediment metagenome]|uniref:Uncharacterized protein n=1 Tax=marine sediment metagenome TaxID=412755 RepID=X1A3F1_9ZZZZ
MYFQDYSQEQQEAIFNQVINDMKEKYPDYKEQAEDCDISVDDWLLDTADNYINCNNRPNEWQGYLI